MQQLNNPIDPPEMSSADDIKPIPQKRAAALASGAMEFSHKLLAVVHKEDEGEIKVTFEEWFKLEGRKVLSMDPKSASEFKAKSEDEEEGSDFEAMPPSQTALQLLAPASMFQHVPIGPNMLQANMFQANKGVLFFQDLRCIRSRIS